MLKHIILGMFTVGFALAAVGAETPGRPMPTLWGCSLPCETDEIPPKPLGSVKLGWCGVSSLTRHMVDAVTPFCKAKYHNEKAVARRVSVTLGGAAKCTSSGNECAEEGPSPIGFSCFAVCPGEAQLVSFSACAITSTAAWDGAADTACAGAKRPSGDILSPSQTCSHSGETPCKP
jgi:hypothetical protein